MIRHAGQQQRISGTARQSVQVQAGLADRFFRVAKGYTYYAGDAAAKALEDPRKMLDQAVEDMRNDLVKMRQASVEVLSAQRLLGTKYQQAQSKADEWHKRAELALRKGEEELAREALRRRKTFADTAASLKTQLDMHTRATQTLMGNIRILESKIAEAQNKKATLKARAMSAQATKQLNEQISDLVGGLRYNADGSIAAFQRMEEKVLALEAEVEAMENVATSDALEGKFALLEGGFTGVEDELDKLKSDLAKMGKLPAQAQSLPSTIVWQS